MQDPQHIETTTTTTPKTPSTRNHSGVKLVAGIALLLALLSLVAQYFLWQSLKDVEVKFGIQAQQLQANFERNLNQMLERFNQQQRSITSLVAATGDENKKKSIFLAEEAKHLVTLSQYTLSYDRNYELGIKQLTEADQKILQINDQTLNPIRQALNDAIVAINATPKIDVTGVAMKIAAISDQVSSLSALPVISSSTKPGTSKISGKTWREKLWATLESLRGVISIRRLPNPIQPLASPEQQLYLVESIKLQLMQAQWALFHQDANVYQVSLENAKKVLRSYYAMNPTGANIINMITELQQLNIKPTLPDLSNILTLLQQYITNSTQTLMTPVRAPGPPAALSAPAMPQPTEPQPDNKLPNNQLPKASNAPIPTSSKPAVPSFNTITPMPRALPS